MAVIVPLLWDMPPRIGLERRNMGGRGSDALVAQGASCAGPIAGKRLLRIEMNVLAAEFSFIGIGRRIGSLATESLFVGIGGALSEGKCWARGMKSSQSKHQTGLSQSCPNSIGTILQDGASCGSIRQIGMGCGSTWLRWWTGLVSMSLLRL